MHVEDKDLPHKQATDWFLELDERPDDPVLSARFDAWLAASPANAAAWADTARIYGMIGQATPVHAAHWAPGSSADGTTPASVPAPPLSAPAPLPARPARPSPPPRRAFRRPPTALALAALAAALAVVVAPKAWLWTQADFMTATGEVRSFQLADGSTVHLAADSAVGVAFGGGERRVRLLKGEAFFEVAPDRDRPFTVATGEAATTVLGTAFEVRQGDAATEVAVVRGRVRVAGSGPRASAPEQLAAGEAVLVAGDGRAVRSTLPPQNVAAWMSGQLLVENRTVREAVDALGRYYGGMIVLTDDALGRQRLTGVYNLSDPAAALRAMAGAHGATVRRISPWLLVLSPGEAAAGRAP